MEYRIAKQTITEAIKSCQSVEYPILVTGQDFGDSLAMALSQVVELTNKVEQLEKTCESLLKQLEESE